MLLDWGWWEDQVDLLAWDLSFRDPRLLERATTLKSSLIREHEGILSEYGVVVIDCGVAILLGAHSLSGNDGLLHFGGHEAVVSLVGIILFVEWVGH